MKSLVRKFGYGIALVMIAAHSLVAQTDLYMNPEVRQAYQNGTRTWDGTVSEKYRQNHTKYRIKAKVIPETRQLHGSAEIIYYHHFPEPLVSLGFHAYKDVFDEGMIIRKLVVAGEELDIRNRKRVRSSDTHYGVFIGKNPLRMGDSVTVEIEWSITIPAEADRDGAYDKTSMTVAYWYPEIAVYDDVYGWDRIDHDGHAEFYHDFSDFDIQIEIPENYVVWASDAPVNADEVYPDFVRERLKTAKSTGKPTEIVGKRDLKDLKMAGTVWKYAVDSFPDFTFSFSDHYLWEAAGYKDQFGEYLLNAAYPAENKAFGDVLEIELDAMQIFHNEFPKYPFPYRHFVAFNGVARGGMEFPGMCNDAARTGYELGDLPLFDYEANTLLTVHEMAHMYFPFLMGINEKRFGWMDEGMAELAETYFSGIDLSNYDDLPYQSYWASNPPIMVETHLIPKNHFVNAYAASSQSYYALYHLLGPEIFDQCMQAYMERWNHKHPLPYDFFFTFNDVSGRDLTWFWNAWYFDWGYPDIGIRDFEEGVVTLVNEGGFPMVTELYVVYARGKGKKILINPAVWENGHVYRLEIPDAGSVKEMRLKPPVGTDYSQRNDVWKRD